MCVLGGTIYFKMENESACEWVCLISVHAEGVCVLTSCIWSAVGSVRQALSPRRSGRPAGVCDWVCPGSEREAASPAQSHHRTYTHTHTHTLKLSIQPLMHFYNQTFPRTRIHTLIKSQQLPISVSMSHEHINIQCDHPHSAAGRRHSNSFHMRRG